MQYKLLISNSAKKEIDNLPLRDQKRVIACLDKIEADPFRGKKLKGSFDKIYSVRVWPMRILYEIYAGKLIVLVLKVVHRKNIYK